MIYWVVVRAEQEQEKEQEKEEERVDLEEPEDYIQVGSKNQINRWVQKTDKQVGSKNQTNRWVQKIKQPQDEAVVCSALLLEDGSVCATVRFRRLMPCRRKTYVSESNAIARVSTQSLVCVCVYALFVSRRRSTVGRTRTPSPGRSSLCASPLPGQYLLSLSDILAGHFLVL